ncbi:MAG TPA: MmcQ/YjbR family DNA-binding protein [Flavobacteriales bacterium]|nr:MmcQ/YjbR family DNA-binding protein [Flavobacteriales bacterium]
MNIELFRELCLALPGVTEETPFGPDTLVFKVSGKIFALTDINTFESVNLKCDPERALELRECYHGILPGYHMNKKHWNTVLADGSVPDALIRELLRHSYDLVVASLPRKAQAALAR